VRLRLSLASALVLLLAAAGAQAANMYKWVDDKGVVHYTDKLPADVVDKGSVELSKQGIPLKRTEAAPTPEQRRAKQLEEERQRQLAREREVVDRRDRALLESYTSPEEIDLARSRALGTLEALMQSAQVYSASLLKRRQELEAQRRTYGDKVPATVERELDGIGSELARQDALIGERKREIAAVTARYDADKQRWKELRAIALARAGIEAAAASGTPGAPGAAGNAGSPRASGTATPAAAAPKAAAH
jgi:hypothetical protein